MKRLLIPLVLAVALGACGGDDVDRPGATTVTTLSSTTTTTTAPTTTTAVPTGGLIGSVTAGPVCPVQKDPPDPDCADRPVADARIIVFDESGAAVAHTTTSENGMFSLDLPPGLYEVVGEPVPGLLGLPAPLTVEIGDAVVPIELSYDTGIR